MDIYIYEYIYMDIYIWIWIYMDIYIYGYQAPDTRSCQVPDRARYQIVPGNKKGFDPQAKSP